ncbi:ureidoglycolate lyase [Rhodobacteraceae bacterium NNCM2]|nr:ureidoglycolate lyase [Coraliihabitans acroporae]
MTVEVLIRPLSQPAFAPFGNVIEIAGEPDMIINQGMCGRYHDLASLDFDAAGRAGISLFHGRPYSLPLRLEMMERHPLGSQAFLPMSPDPFLVVVARDEGGRPADLQAFLASPGQGVNYRRGVWHGVLMPLDGPALFACVDRIGEGDNLEEHWFDTPPVIRIGSDG